MWKGDNVLGVVKDKDLGINVCVGGVWYWDVEFFFFWLSIFINVVFLNSIECVVGYWFFIDDKNVFFYFIYIVIKLLKVYFL